MISQQEYQARRQQLASQMTAGSIAVIPAANEMIRNGDSEYRFRQNSDFFYLTGFNEPNAILLVSAEPKAHSVLLCQSRDPAQEQWTGRRLGQTGAIQELGMHAAYPITEFAARLAELCTDKQAIYYPIGQAPLWEQRILEAWQTIKQQNRRGIKAPDALCDLGPILSEMRLLKSPAEIAMMREVTRISATAHQRAMQVCRHAQFEYQLEAEFLYEIMRQGCRNVAYDSIIASGENACILHYTANDKALKAGELVLIDAGGELNNYAADISRTFPVTGRFSAEQRQIYSLVLQAQKAGIACVCPGCRWNEIQDTIIQILTTGLVDLGILQGDIASLIAEGAHKPFYMHGSGHWLGLDVHDVGRYKIDGQWRQLKPNMVLTVEPGIYISPMPNVDERWWHIGVRIEDDILVTETGSDNLSASLPVELDDIEALCCG